MGWWLASERDQLRHDWIKRFDPRFWTVNFPRPMMAAVTTTTADALQVDLAFLKGDDLAGLIWESEDRFDHPLLRFATARDYRGLTLGFRWQADGGVLPLDAVNGPVLTIEGRNAGGAPRSWYVRLWNYALGTPDDAQISLDFDALDGGFLLPGEADPVWAGDIDRLFIGLHPAGYNGTDAPLATTQAARVTLSDIICDGPRSTLAIGDAFVPPHALRMATAYDDSYNLNPARLVRGIVQLGYQSLINHYVGMSHYPALAHDGSAFRVDPEATVCAPCTAWHAAFAREAAAYGFDIIMSLSFELLDSMAPEAWKQRDAEGQPALTGWVPPSTLLSPANAEAMGWLCAVACSFADLAAAAGLPVKLQVGEPWWWVGADSRPFLYDAATLAAFGSDPGSPITDMRMPPDATQRAYLDWLGAQLAAATLALRDVVRAAHPAAALLLLFYAPQVLRPDAPDLLRLNLPDGWAHPAWDVLQLEDYDFVTGGNFAGQAAARDAVTQRLGYPLAQQHYLAGFVAAPAARDQWQAIAAAADAAQAAGVAEVFVWSWPQVARDGFTTFRIEGDETMPAFHDVRFPLELGFGATGGPQFSTQIAVTASGHEQRNSSWSESRLRYDAGVGVRSETDLAALIGFFRARRGQAHGFRFRDPLDHCSRDDGQPPQPSDQALGSGDGVATRFALIKSYGTIDAQQRRITRPDPATLRVAIDGAEQLAGWTLGDGGHVDFALPPAAGAAISAGFLFDVPVRFADDHIDVSLAGWRSGDLPSVPLVEIREA